MRTRRLVGLPLALCLLSFVPSAGAVSREARAAAARPARSAPSITAHLPRGAHSRADILHAYQGAVLDSMERMRTRVAAASVSSGVPFAPLFLPVRDMDGDGVRDVIQIVDNFSSDTVDTEITMRSGRDAHELWHASINGGWEVGIIPAPVGPHGAAGVLVVKYESIAEDAIVAGAEVPTLTVTALDGKSGKDLWSRQFKAVFTGSVGHDAGAQLPVVDDFLANGPGRPWDTLLSIVDVVATPVNYVTRVQAATVSGVDGTVANRGVPVVGNNTEAVFQWLPDVSADGRDDYSEFDWSQSGPSPLLARRSPDGAELWRAAPIASPFPPYVVDLGDLTRDRRHELSVVLVGLGFLVEGGSGGPVSPSQPKNMVTVLDGATGRVALQAAGDLVEPLGDVDHDRKGDLAVIEQTQGDSLKLTVSATTLAGKVRWKVTRRLSGAPSGKEGRSRVSAGALGDVNSDGITDIGYLLEVVPLGALTRQDGGWIDGRTGRVRRDARPGLYGLPVAVDGRGEDAVSSKLTKGTFVLSTWRGQDGRLLWQTALHVDSALNQEFYRFGTAMDRDRCGDILLTLSGPNVTSLLAFDGASGRVKWQLFFRGSKPTINHPQLTKRTDHNSCH